MHVISIAHTACFNWQALVGDNKQTFAGGDNRQAYANNINNNEILNKTKLR